MTGGGGRHIYGEPFDDENYDLKHAGPGVLSTASMGRNANKSQFYLSLRPMPQLDGRQCVFGQVVNGYDTIKAIGSVGSSCYNPCGCTYHEVIVADCGVLGSEETEAEITLEASGLPQFRDDRDHNIVELEEDCVL